MVELGAFLFNKFGKSTDLSKLQLQACSNENDTSEEVLSEEVKVVILRKHQLFLSTNVSLRTKSYHKIVIFSH